MLVLLLVTREDLDQLAVIFSELALQLVAVDSRRHLLISFADFGKDRRAEHSRRRIEKGMTVICACSGTHGSPFLFDLKKL